MSIDPPCTPPTSSAAGASSRSPATSTPGRGPGGSATAPPATWPPAGRSITGDTAFDVALPTGRGLFAFTDVGSAAAAVDAIESDYAGHCRAAREIAAEYFAADKVLGSVMRRAGLA